MFGQAWTECRDRMTAAAADLPPMPRAALKQLARAFFEFAVADLTRHQLMNQKAIPMFTPSAESYRPAVETLETVREHLTACGFARSEDVDLYLAMGSGLIDAQLANDLGGDRFQRLLDRAVDLLADDVGLPPDCQASAA